MYGVLLLLCVRAVSARFAKFRLLQGGNSGEHLSVHFKHRLVFVACQLNFLISVCHGPGRPNAAADSSLFPVSGSLTA